MKNRTRQKYTQTNNEINSSKKPRRFLFLIPLFIGIAGFVILLASTSKYGVGISGDSADYIIWARNFIATHSFTKPNGDSLIILPPLYPIFIAFFKLCGINDFLGVRLINSLSLCIIIFLTGLWVLKYSGSLIASILSSVLILFSYPIISVCCWAWTEPLFMAFIVIFLFLIPQAVNKPDIKTILILGIVTSATCLTRYAGIALLPVGGIALLAGIKGFRKKMLFTSLWGLAAVIPFGLWLIRNMRRSGTMMGSRFPSTTTLIQNIKLSGDIIKRWFFLRCPEFISGWLFFVLLAISVLAVLAFYFYKFIKSKDINISIAAVSLYIAVYTTAIIYAATTTSLGSFEDRYLIPAYPAVVMFIGIFAVKLVGLNKKLVRYISVICIIIFAGFWLHSGINYTIAISRQLSQNGFGFANSNWKNSATIAWLKANKLNGQIYANDIHGIYLYANVNSYLVPAKPDYYENTSENTKIEIRKQLAKFESVLDSGQNVYLVWFRHHFRYYLYDPQELQAFCDIKLIRQLNDGYIIALYPKNSLSTQTK